MLLGLFIGMRNSLFNIIGPFFSFHNSKEEITKGYDVTPQLSDDIQLTVDEYRRKLYEVKSVTISKKNRETIGFDFVY